MKMMDTRSNRRDKLVVTSREWSFWVAGALYRAGLHALTEGG